MSDEPDVPLDIIGDFLEDNGKPGQAAAARVLAHMLAEGYRSIGMVLDDARKTLTNLDQIPMGVSLAVATAKLAATRDRAVTPTIGAPFPYAIDQNRRPVYPAGLRGFMSHNPQDAGAVIRNGVTIRDLGMHLDRMSSLWDVLIAWIDDPAPKLRGLRIEIEPEGDPAYPSMLLRMRCHRDGERLRQTSIPMMQLGLRERGQQFHHALESLQLGLVRDIRDATMATTTT